MTIDEPATPPCPRLELEPAESELATWIELLGCDGDLERMLRRLDALRAGLALPPAGRAARAAPAAELDVALGCFADHLHPARKVVRRFEESFFPGVRAEVVAAWARRLREDKAAGHERFRGFLADARGDALPALRHLLGCPLCERLARLVLFGFHPGAADRPGRRRRRRRRKRRETRRPESCSPNSPPLKT